MGGMGGSKIGGIAHQQVETYTRLQVGWDLHLPTSSSKPAPIKGTPIVCIAKMQHTSHATRSCEMHHQVCDGFCHGVA